MTNRKFIVVMIVLILSLTLNVGLGGMVMGQEPCADPCDVTIERLEEILDCDCPDPIVMPIGTRLVKPAINTPDGVTCRWIADEVVDCTYDEEPEPCVPEIRIVPTAADDYARWSLGVGYGSGLGFKGSWDPKGTDSWSIWAPQTFSAAVIDVADARCTVDSQYDWSATCQANGSDVAWAVFADWWF